jgi:2-polyprenyl-3-methyl-5-hydroxy-6-metoxy-1,4-benzoquinol methylase
MTPELTSFGAFRGRLVEVGCGLCGSQEPRKLVFCDQAGIGYFRCLSCGLLYASPRFDEESLKNIYETGEFADLTPFEDWSYEKWENRRDRAFFTEEHKVKLLARFIPAGARVLDIGAGTGLFVYLARRRRYAAEALEPSAMLAQVAREKVGIPVTEGDIFGFQPPHLFDAAFLWDVLEHLSNPLAVLKKTACLLEPDGLVFLQVPHWAGLSERYKTWLCKMKLRSTYKNFGFPWHLYSFDRQSLRWLLEAAGFTPVLFESWSHQMKDGQEGIFSRLAITLAKRYCLTDYLVAVAQRQKTRP